MGLMRQWFPDSQERRFAWLLIIAALLILFAGYGLRDPWPADEPRFVLVAKQMVESGDYLFPHRGIELYPDKPPFYFWLLALCYHLIGSWRWSFLLPGVIGGLITLYLSFDMARRLWTPRAGLYAAGAVLLCFQFVYQFKRAQIDPLLVTLTTMSLYSLLRFYLLEEKKRWLILGGFFAGLGVISKGVGFLPLLLVPIAMLMRRYQWQGLSAKTISNRKASLWLSLSFIAALLVWLGPVLAVGLTSGNPEHELYLQNILFKQTAGRYANPWGHIRPFWYFAEVIAFYWLPFSLILFWVWRQWKHAFSQRNAMIWMPLAWSMLVVIFFSLSSGKRDMYILPALPAVALAAAPFMHEVLRKFSVQIALRVFAIAGSLLVLLVGIYALSGDWKVANKFAVERGLSDQAYYLWMKLIAVGVVCILAAFFTFRKNALWSASTFFLALWLTYGFIVHPLLDAENSARGVMQQARQQAGTETEIGLLNWKEQNLLQARGPTVNFGFLRYYPHQHAEAMAWLRAKPETRRILAQNGEPCVDYQHPAAQKIGVSNRREWWLIAAPALVPGCVLKPASAQATVPEED
jgi:4-amino-4-deoxy-L-arabinose transferase-like glycosyltransferase